MKVKARITFEVEYNINLEFYKTDDKHKALEMERICVAGDPQGIIDTFDARGQGTFETSVEMMDLEPERARVAATRELSPMEAGEVTWLLKSGWFHESIAEKMKIPVMSVYAIERKT